MDFKQTKELYQTYIANTYARNDILVGSGSGVTLTGDDDKQYIDFSSGIGVNSFGFAYPAWVKAVKDQADTLGHMSNLYYTKPQAELAKALCDRTSMKRVFFANSGAEANEGAIKTARKYGNDNYGPHRHEIITLVNSFHGRTITTLAATGQDVFHEKFGPFPTGFVYAEAGNMQDLRGKVTGSTCAILIECIQGEGGVVPLDAAFVKAISDICAERDILLMVDEVQTGIGRTGKLMCYEHFGLRPDVVTLAKGLGGGLPIGAVLFGEKTQDTLQPGDHGSTFGGNPVACAGANAVLGSIDDAFLADVAQKGDYIAQQIRVMPGVLSVTGRGLMLGVELGEGLTSAKVRDACAQRGLIVLTAKHKVRLLPPLNIPMEEIKKGLAILKEALTACKEEQH